MYYDVDLRKVGREKHMEERNTNNFTRWVRSKKTVCVFMLLK